MIISPKQDQVLAITSLVIKELADSNPEVIRQARMRAAEKLVRHIADNYTEEQDDTCSRGIRSTIRVVVLKIDDYEKAQEAAYIAGLRDGARRGAGL